MKEGTHAIARIARAGAGCDRWVRVAMVVTWKRFSLLLSAAFPGLGERPDRGPVLTPVKLGSLSFNGSPRRPLP